MPEKIEKNDLIDLKGWCFLKITTYVSYKKIAREAKEKFDFWKEKANIKDNNNIINEDLEKNKK
jgi:hypothetical protein